MMKKTDIKKQLVKEYISLELIKLNPGAFLPSRRRIMAATGVGRQITEQVLKQEISAGHIKCLPRRGYVKTASADRQFNVYIAEHLADSPYFSKLIKNMASEAEKRQISLQLEYGSVPEANQCPDNLFIIAGRSEEEIFRLRSAGKKCIAILPRYNSASGGTVKNSERLVDMQLDELVRRGCRKIGYIHQETETRENYTFLLRRESYYRWMAEHGLRTWPHHVCPAGNDSEAFQEALRKMFTVNPVPEAVICPASKHLKQLYSFLRSLSLRPMFDIMIASDGEPENTPVPHPLQIKNSPAEVAKLAWILMERACSGSPKAEETLVPQWGWVHQKKTPESMQVSDQ